MKRSRRGSRGESTEGYLQIGSRCAADGLVSGRGLALVHGVLQGNVTIDGDLVVASGGRVNDLAGHVHRLRVEGVASCRIVADSVEVASSGRLEGDLETTAIQASSGARIEARLRLRPAHSRGKEDDSS